MKKIINTILKITGSVLLILLLIELSFTIYRKYYVDRHFYDLRYKQYVSKPHSYYFDSIINSSGFNDLEFTKEKDNNIFRIVATGDSYAFGAVPYRFNFLTYLEDMLNTKNKSFEVYNLGVPCIGTHDYLSLIVQEGLDYKPDLIMVCFTVIDDFGNRKWYTRTSISSLCKSIIDSRKKWEGIIVHGPGKYDESYSELSGKFTDYVASKSDVFLLNKSKSATKKYNATIYNLLKINEICKMKNIPLVVAFLPAEIQISKKMQSSVISYMKAKPEDFDFMQPTEFLTGEFKKNNITYIDTTEELRRISKNGEVNLYIPNDVHFNIKGNKLVAEILKRRLEEIIKQNKRAF